MRLLQRNGKSWFSNKENAEHKHNENGKIRNLELLEIMDIFTTKWGGIVQNVENSFWWDFFEDLNFQLF